MRFPGYELWLRQQRGLCVICVVTCAEAAVREQVILKTNLRAGADTTLGKIGSTSNTERRGWWRLEGAQKVKNAK